MALKGLDKAMQSEKHRIKTEKILQDVQITY